MSTSGMPVRRSKLFASEASLHAAVSGYFTHQGIPHTNQHPIPGGGSADIALELPDGRPWALIELKNDLDASSLVLADASDFFEQAAKYRIATGLPVFIGPFFQPSMGLARHFTGGVRPKAIAALSAIGGRFDVGLFFLHALTGYETRHDGWFGFQLTLRQQRQAAFHEAGYGGDTLWPTAPLPLVDLFTAGSRRDRSAA